MRQDAARNREKLIAAASEIMRNEGDAVPMEVFAERANLTRATLYRNFPHRQAMYDAVLQSDLNSLTHRIATGGVDDALAFIRFTTELITVYDKFLGNLVDMPDYDAEKSQSTMREVLVSPLAAAKAAGLIRDELTPEDILTVCRMLAALWKLDNKPNFSDAYQHRFALIFQGIGKATTNVDPKVGGRKNLSDDATKHQPTQRKQRMTK